MTGKKLEALVVTLRKDGDGMLLEAKDPHGDGKNIIAVAPVIKPDNGGRHWAEWRSPGDKPGSPYIGTASGTSLTDLAHAAAFEIRRRMSVKEQHGGFRYDAERPREIGVVLLHTGDGYEMTATNCDHRTVAEAKVKISTYPDSNNEDIEITWRTPVDNPNMQGEYLCAVNHTNPAIIEEAAAEAAEEIRRHFGARTHPGYAEEFLTRRTAKPKPDEQADEQDGGIPEFKTDSQNLTNSITCLMFDSLKETYGIYRDEDGTLRFDGVVLTTPKE